jgi:hypothetical protein
VSKVDSTRSHSDELQAPKKEKKELSVISLSTLKASLTILLSDDDDIALKERL